jgi:hypothetical protein
VLIVRADTSQDEFNKVNENESTDNNAPVIRRKFPSFSALANGRNKITVKYAGINKSEPIRNMAR